MKCLELFAKYDPNTQSLKTALLYLFEDLKESFLNFPQSGIMQNGNVYRTTLLDTLIGEQGCTLLPTPTKSDTKARFKDIDALSRYLVSGHQVRMMDYLCHKGFTLSQRVKMLEMVMGYDIGHSELEALETP